MIITLFVVLLSCAKLTELTCGLNFIYYVKILIYMRYVKKVFSHFCTMFTYLMILYVLRKIICKYKT